MVCIPDIKKSFTICLVVSTEYQQWHVTDRRTDILRRAVKTVGNTRVVSVQYDAQFLCDR